MRAARRSSRRAGVAAATLVALVAVVARPARAEEPARADAPARGDTSYGRVEGDLAVAVGAGLAMGPRAPRAAADLRLRYLETVGIFGQYEEGAAFGRGADPARVVATGLELRPLFLARWLQSAETGAAFWDLALDSLGLEVGVVLTQPAGGALGTRPGLQVGLGLELPILPRASGPWIGVHGGVRWSDLALARGEVAGALDRAAYLAVTLAWHQLFGASVIDARDGRPR